MHLPAAFVLLSEPPYTQVCSWVPFYMPLFMLFVHLKLLPQMVARSSPAWSCYHILNNPPYVFNRNPYFLLSFCSPPNLFHDTQKMAHNSGVYQTQSSKQMKYLTNNQKKKMLLVDCQGYHSLGVSSAVLGYLTIDI